MFGSWSFLGTTGWRFPPSLAWPKVDFHWVEVTRVLPSTETLPVISGFFFEWSQETRQKRLNGWHVEAHLICRWTWGCTLLLAESQNILFSLELFNCHEANEDFQLAQYSLLVGKYSWNSLPRSLHMLQNWNHYESMSEKAGRKATKC